MLSIKILNTLDRSAGPPKFPNFKILTRNFSRIKSNTWHKIGLIWARMVQKKAGDKSYGKFT